MGYIKQLQFPTQFFNHDLSLMTIGTYIALSDAFFQHA